MKINAPIPGKRASNLVLQGTRLAAAVSLALVSLMPGCAYSEPVAGGQAQPVSPAGVAAAVPVTIDIGSQPRQTFQGLGVGTGNSLDHLRPEQREYVEQKLYRDLNLTSLRIWFDVSTYAAKPGTRDPKYFQGVAGQVSDAIRYGVREMLLAPTNPGGYMMDPQTHHISDQHLTEYTQCIADGIKDLRDNYGIRIAVTGVGNEPGWLNGPSQLVVMVKSLRRQLDAYGLTNVKIIAPEGPSNDDYWAAYIFTLKGDPDAWKVLDGIANHSYWNTARPVEANAIDGTDKEYWNTESGATLPASTLPLAATGADFAARFLNDVDERMTNWMAFIGASPAGDEIGHRVILLNPGQKEFCTLIPTYWYLRQLSETFNTGAVFRSAFSSLDNTVMYRNLGAAAARNADGSWGIALANRSGEPRADPLKTYDATVNIPELQNSGDVVFDVHESGPDQNDVYIGHETMVHGSVTISGIGQYELVTLRSVPGQLDSGHATREIFLPGSTAGAASAGAVAPSSVFQPVASLDEKPLSGAYGARTRGFIIAPETGPYTFWIAGQGNAELWLSPSEEPADAVKIAWTNGNGAFRKWNASSSQKSNGNPFHFNGGAPGVIKLTQGGRYYFELLEKQGARDVAVAWARPGDSTLIADGDVNAGGLGGLTAYAPAPSPAPDRPQGAGPGSAAFVSMDTTTLGNWSTAHGADGYSIVDDQDAFPDYVNVRIGGQADDSSPGDTTDPRGLIRGENRAKRFWAYWRGNISVDMDFLDGQTHLFSLYSDREGADFNVTVIDLASGKTLDTRKVIVAPSGATYCTWKLGARVGLRFSPDGKGEPTYSGFFFGPGPGRTAPPEPVHPPAADGTWSVVGCGNGVGGDFDQFRLISARPGPDCSVIGRVSSQSSKDQNARAGIMLRESSGGSAAFASLSLSPSGELVLDYRGTAGSQAQHVHLSGDGLGKWLRLASSGGVISAAVSTDGSGWSTVGDPIHCALDAAELAGAFVSSGTNLHYNTASFTGLHALRPDGSPTDWDSLDLGAPQVAGRASLDPSQDQWTVQGTGQTSNGVVQGHAVETTIGACNGVSLVSRLDSVSGGSGQAFAALGLYDSKDATGAIAEDEYFPNLGVIRFGFRAASGGLFCSPSLEGVKCPLWLKIVRHDYYSIEGLYSTDGKNWTSLGGTWGGYSNMRPENYRAALFVQSQDTTSLTTAKFSHFWLGGEDSLPPGWSTADIGQRIIQGRDLAPYENVARGQMGGALSTAEPAGADAAALLALPKQPNNPGDAKPQWARLDLGQEVSLEGFRVKWGEAFPANYQFLISSDGRNWETRYETSSGRGGTEQVDLSHRGLRARYVALGMPRDPGTGAEYKIQDFQVLGRAANLAATAAITASSYLPCYQPFKIADGYDSTLWAADAGASPVQWVQFDLGQETCVSRVAINWHGNDYAQAYSVQVGDDPAFATSATYYATDSGRPGCADLAGQRVIGHYLRIVMTRPETTRYSISELEINGDAVQESGILANGRFEAPILDAPTTSSLRPLGAGWDFAGNAGIQVDNSNPAVPGQCAFLDGAASTIAQKFESVDGAYSIRCLAAAGGPQGQPIRISVDGVPVGAPIVPANGNFTPFALGPVPLKTGGHELKIEGLSATAPGASRLKNIVLVRLTPSAPEELVAAATAAGSVLLTWTPSPDGAGCEIDRSADGVTFQTIARLNHDAGTYADQTVQKSATYTYRVQAVNAAGPSGYSRESATTTLSDGGADLALGDGSNVTSSSTDGNQKYLVNGLEDHKGFSTDWWGQTPHWLQIDLGRTVLINRVDLYGNGDGKFFPVDFTIDISMDGKTFTRAATIEGWPQPKDDVTPQSFTFPPAPARYVRLNAWKTGQLLQIGKEKIYAARD